MYNKEMKVSLINQYMNMRSFDSDIEELGKNKALQCMLPPS